MTLKLKSFIISNLLAGFCSLLLLLGLSQSAFAQEQKLSDDAIENAVEADLWIDKTVDMNNIDVKVNEGILTLTGTADNILIKDRAVRIAENIRGVRAVVNRINVKSHLHRSDLEIKRDVTSALFRDPATDSYEIEVEVDDRKVTLNGTVQSWAEKRLSESVVKSVKGVHEIQNNITIEYKEQRSDYEITQDVKGRLANDVKIFDSLIEVEVDDGTVNLIGTVGSLKEKNRALSDAWVNGVNDVNTDALMVQWWARDHLSKKKKTVLKDSEIQKAVKDALVYDPRVFSFNPEVHVEQGVITLTGTVDNYLAKLAAEEDARNTVGVLMVQNYLKVRPVSIPANDKLEENVADALRNDPYIERFELSIDASNGIVYLSGNVNTSFEKQHAESVVQSVKGVTNIVSTVEYEYQWTWKPDWEIKRDVEQQLTWSVFTDLKQIDVSVKQGIVTLDGTADTWIEYNAAEKNAYEAGAKDVNNNLDVQYDNYGPYYYWGLLNY